MHFDQRTTGRAARKPARLRSIFRRRFTAIAIGSVSCGVVGAVAAAAPLPAPTRLIGGCLLCGSAAAVVFWALRLWFLPAAGPSTRRWLRACYAIGAGALAASLGIAVWAAATGFKCAVFWLYMLLVAIELGELFGVRWVDGQGRLLPRRRLGGAAWVGLAFDRRVRFRRERTA